MWWQPQQLDFRSCFFPRAIKQQSKVFKGEFIVLNFSDTMFANIIQGLNVSNFENATAIGNSAAEFEAINGTKLKIKTMQEGNSVI